MKKQMSIQKKEAGAVKESFSKKLLRNIEIARMSSKNLRDSEPESLGPHEDFLAFLGALKILTKKSKSIEESLIHPFEALDEKSKEKVWLKNAVDLQSELNDLSRWVDIEYRKLGFRGTQEQWKTFQQQLAQEADRLLKGDAKTLTLFNDNEAQFNQAKQIIAQGLADLDAVLDESFNVLGQARQTLADSVKNHYKLENPGDFLSKIHFLQDLSPAEWGIFDKKIASSEHHQLSPLTKKLQAFCMGSNITWALEAQVLGFYVANSEKLGPELSKATPEIQALFQVVKKINLENLPINEFEKLIRNKEDPLVQFILQSPSTQDLKDIFFGPESTLNSLDDLISLAQLSQRRAEKQGSQGASTEKPTPPTKSPKR